MARTTYLFRNTTIHRFKTELSHFADFCDLKSVGELIDEDVLNLDTGDEIGRLNYGTGQIAFVRTSDLGTYELKADFASME